MVNLPFLLTWWNPWPRRWCCLARVRNVCHKAHSKSLKGQKRKKFNAFHYSKSVYGRRGVKLTFKGPLVQFKIQIIDLPVDLGSSDPLYQISRNLSIKTPSSHSNSLCIYVNYTWYFSSRTHFIDFAVQFHDLGRFHEFLLESAAHPLPVLSFPANTFVCSLEYYEISN